MTVPEGTGNGGRLGSKAVTPSKEGSGTWSIGAVLTGAMMFGTATFFVLAVLSPLLIRDLGLSRAQLGLLPTLIYGLGALLSPWGGGLADRFGGRAALTALFASAAVGLLVLSLARTYPMVVVGALITGLATAITTPGTNQVIARHVRRTSRGPVTGVKQSGIQLGGLLSGLALPALAVAVGWRGGAAIVAAGSLLMIGVTVLVVPGNGRRPPATRLRPRRWAPSLPKDPVTLWVAAYGFFMGAGASSVGVYLPLYVVEGLGRSVAVGGLATSALSVIGIAARIITGARLRELHRPHVALGAAAALAVVGPPCLLAAMALGTPMLWVGLSFIGVGTACWIIIAVVAILDVVPAQEAGKTSGVMQLAFYGGFSASPALMGLLIDWRGSYVVAWWLVTATFVMAFVVAALWSRYAAVATAGRNRLNP